MGALAQALMRQQYLKPFAEGLSEYARMKKQEEAKRQFENSFAQSNTSMDQLSNPNQPDNFMMSMPGGVPFDSGVQMPKLNEEQKYNRANEIPMNFAAKNLMSDVDPNIINRAVSILGSKAGMMKPQQKQPVKGVVINGRLVNPYTGEPIADFSDQQKPAEQFLGSSKVNDIDGTPRIKDEFGHINLSDEPVGILKQDNINEPIRNRPGPGGEIEIDNPVMDDYFLGDAKKVVNHDKTKFREWKDPKDTTTSGGGKESSSTGGNDYNFSNLYANVQEGIKITKSLKNTQLTKNQDGYLEYYEPGSPTPKVFANEQEFAKYKETVKSKYANDAVELVNQTGLDGPYEKTPVKKIREAIEKGYTPDEAIKLFKQNNPQFDEASLNLMRSYFDLLTL